MTASVTDQGPCALQDLSTTKLLGNVEYLRRSKVLKELGLMLRIKSRLVSVHIKFQVLTMRL